MHRFTLIPCGLALALLGSPSARACEPVVIGCRPAVVMVPAYTPEGFRVGIVAAEVALPRPLERSPFTGQPRTVVFNDPDSFPGAVDPEFERVPLPRVPRFHTRAVYPRGY